MQNSTKSHGYESLMLIVLVLAVVFAIISFAIPALHYGHVNIADNIHRLFDKLQSS